MNDQTITLYEAIHEMRRISANGEYFSFSFASYNRKLKSTHGLIHVKRAKLRPAAKGDDIANADYKLFYFDDFFQENRVCWQPLLMFFNGKQILLQ